MMAISRRVWTPNQFKSQVFIACVVSLALTACGGGGGGGGGGGDGSGGGSGGVTSHQLNVTVTGLSGSLTLQNNGKDSLELHSDGMTRFATPLDLGAAYNVTVQTQPADRVCVVNNGTGVVVAAVNINVTCSAARALFMTPRGVALDAAGNLVVADSGTIRMISPSGRTSTLAGEAGFTGAVDGLGSVARFNSPADVVVDKSGFIYVADSRNHVIRKVNKSGLVQTWAGASGFSGYADGTGNSARFYSPRGLVADSSGNVYVADTANSVIRKITPDGVVSTFAGKAGEASLIYLNSPEHMAIDKSGNIYVNNGPYNVDGFGYLQKIAPDGKVSFQYLFDAVTGSRVNIGVRGIAVDPVSGNLFVLHKQAVKMINKDGFVSVFAGSPDQTGYQDGVGTEARFNHPNDIVADGGGNLFVSDGNNNVIRKITSSGSVSTYAGTPGVSGWLDN